MQTLLAQLHGAKRIAVDGNLLSMCRACTDDDSGSICPNRNKVDEMITQDAVLDVCSDSLVYATCPPPIGSLSDGIDALTRSPTASARATLPRACALLYAVSETGPCRV